MHKPSRNKLEESSYPERRKECLSSIRNFHNWLWKFKARERLKNFPENRLHVVTATTRLRTNLLNFFHPAIFKMRIEIKPSAMSLCAALLLFYLPASFRIKIVSASTFVRDIIPHGFIKIVNSILRLTGTVHF